VHLAGRLEITAGQTSDRGKRATNEDCMGLRIPEEPLLTLKGVAAVIADGVSSAEAGREASEHCVRGFLTDYFSTPESWSVKRSAQVVLTALNRWLYGRSHRLLEAHRGCVSTFTAVVIKSRTAHVLHVGDTRLYLLRDGSIEQLTRDHATAITERERYLSRAVGMDAELDVDYRTLELRAGDVLLSTTDGIHDWLRSDELHGEVVRGLASGHAFEDICAMLIARAKERGSDDNLTCQLLRIDAVAAAQVDEFHRRLTEVPFPPPLSPGKVLDGLRIERELYASARSQIYLVLDLDSNERLAMKTPSVNFEDDPAYIERFVMESWVGRRVEHPNVVRVIERARPRSCLYYVMEYVEGPTLAEWRASRAEVGIREVAELVAQIASGLHALHRKEMFHQDLKPQNVVIGSDGRARIVDLGSCWVGGIREIEAPVERDVALGSASYAAPENRWGETAGVRSDLFSLGSIAYELLTGKLPYGEAIESARTPRDCQRLRYTPSYVHDPLIPAWIDGALRTAVAIDPRQRYAELSELVHDLQYPNPKLAEQTPLSLVERHPVRFWQGLALALGALEIVTLWMLLGR
jgi:serine/threonine protein phosphatase PrpC